jgi:hypothetical protein
VSLASHLARQRSHDIGQASRLRKGHAL